MFQRGIECMSNRRSFYSKYWTCAVIKSMIQWWRGYLKEWWRCTPASAQSSDSQKHGLPGRHRPVSLTTPSSHRAPGSEGWGESARTPGGMEKHCVKDIWHMNKEAFSKSCWMVNFKNTVEEWLKWASLSPVERSTLKTLLRNDLGGLLSILLSGQL